METIKLMNELSAYGADINGINARFYGDYELYEKCFRRFFCEKNHTLLADCMKKSDFENAFSAAHALKGLAGNMGLVPYYDTVCRLVETLRTKDYGSAGAEYEAVEQQFDRLVQAFPALLQDE